MKEVIFGILLGSAFTIFFFVAMYLMVGNAI
jgi:type III secretory pathway component EscT